MPYKSKDLRRANYWAKREQKLAVARAYTAAHQAEISQRRAAYRLAHKEDTRAYNATYHLKHRDERLLYMAEYKTVHPEEIKRSWETYRDTHKEEIKKTQRKYRQAHKDEINAKNRRRQARQQGAVINDFTAAQWQEMKAHYGHRCVYCDRKMQRLTMDHITPLAKGGNHTKSNIVPACQTCNSRKHTRPPLKPVQPLLL